MHGVFGRWASIVGSEVAAHCVPESFAEGRLKVRTDSTAWATQLRLLAPNVVRRMNEELGHGTVTVIDVIGSGWTIVDQGPPVGSRRPRPARHLWLSRPTLDQQRAHSRSGGCSGVMRGTNEPLRGARTAAHGPLSAHFRRLRTPKLSAARRRLALSRLYWPMEERPRCGRDFGLIVMTGASAVSAMHDPARPAAFVLTRDGLQPQPVCPVEADRLLRPGGLSSADQRRRAEPYDDSEAADPVQHPTRCRACYRAGVRRLGDLAARGPRGGPQAARHVHRIDR